MSLVDSLTRIQDAMSTGTNNSVDDEPTLDTVQPFEPTPYTPEPYDYTQGGYTPEAYKPPDPDVSLPAFQSPDIPTPAEYVSPGRYAPTPEQTVAGQMEGLLASGSPYIEARRKSGERVAHKRGLLDSSLAAEAAEKAGIEAALPIASQQADVYTQAGLQEYGGMIQGALAKQMAEDTAQGYKYQTDASAALADRQAQQVANQSRYDSLLASGLDDRRAAAALNLTAEEAKIAAAQSNRDTVASLALDFQQQEGYNYRQEIDNRANELINKMNLASQEKSTFATNLNNLGNQFALDWINIQNNPDILDKATRIAGLQQIYEANVSNLAAIYGPDINFTPLVEEPGADAGAGTGGDAGAGGEKVPNVSGMPGTLPAGNQERFAFDGDNLLLSQEVKAQLTDSQENQLLAESAYLMEHGKLPGFLNTMSKDKINEYMNSRIDYFIQENK